MIRLSRGLVCAALLFAALTPPTQAGCNADIPLTRPDSRYVDNGDGTVTDQVTHLMWKQCAEGLSTAVASCDTGGAIAFTWQTALQRAADVNGGSAGENLGHQDWRVPNYKELMSLVETACDNPAINATRFPSTPSSSFWTASPATVFVNAVWGVDFAEGLGGFISKAMSDISVRLVRSAE